MNSVSEQQLRLPNSKIMLMALTCLKSTTQVVGKNFFTSKILYDNLWSVSYVKGRFIPQFPKLSSSLAESLMSHACTEIERPETPPIPLHGMFLSARSPPFGKKKSMK